MLGVSYWKGGRCMTTTRFGGPFRQFALRAFMNLATILVPTAGALAETGDYAHGMVATVHPLATDAGVDVLRGGGNAVDAAVAAALTLGVVDGHNSGLGGGCFILIRTADGKLVAIDGRECAPAKARRDMYVRDGRPQPELSQTGALASGVPGALAAYALALEQFGRRDLKRLLLPAAEIAERGFPIDEVYADAILSTATILAKDEGARAVLLKPDGSPYLAGETLRQPDLARTYRSIAEQGTDWFYRGEFAEATGRWMAKHGGILSAADFADYRAVSREPIVSTYRGYTIVGFPPPSSGGTHVAQILNVLEHFDLAELRRDDEASYVHVVAEAMKLAFADRAYWLGDADFVAVPRTLIDKNYAAELAPRIDVGRVSRVDGHGTPPRATSDLFGKHTTHIAAADRAGNWVAITATVNTPFGSKVIVPGLGVVMNNEMDDFSIAPGVPNAFGLIGAEANAIEPGKRPLSSMSPTIVLQDGQPVLTLGAAGGPRIITQVVLAIVNHVDLGEDLPRAVAAPRFHHQWSPDVLYVEPTLSAEVVRSLEARGHVVERSAQAGVLQAIGVADDGRSLVGVHDPRSGGKAAGD